ncbi:hypothetical protein LTR95_013159 [Oleoguttula sp. CCFEE 5521]
MAACHIAPSPSFLAAFLPVARASLLPQIPRTSSRSHVANRIAALWQLRSSLLPAALIPIPGILEGLWEGILRAVPKKKTSHMKKRHRFMAGKGLKDVTALNKCSACGKLKRAHVLCPYCVQSIRQWFGNGFKTEAEVKAQKDAQWDEMNERLQKAGRKPLLKEDVEDLAKT